MIEYNEFSLIWMMEIKLVDRRLEKIVIVINYCG